MHETKRNRLRQAVKQAAAGFLTLAVLLGMTPGGGVTQVQAADKGTAISTASDLLKMKNSSDRFYLANDIDMTGYGLWEPIDFKGTLDGNNHAISNLKVSGNAGGLFDDIENAVIKDLELKDIDKSGDIPDYRGYDGALACSASGCDISGVTVSGEMDSDGPGEMDDYHSYVGGLIGFLDGKSVMEQCVSSVNIQFTTGANFYIGGLVGTVGSGAVVQNSYNTGTVHSVYTGETDYIKNSYYYDHRYYDMYTSKTLRACGLVGDLKGKLYNCYNIGTVTATSYGSCAWLAYIDDGTAQGCYGLEGSAENDWFNKSGSNNPVRCAAKTESELYTQSTYVGWDFTDVWTINPAKNDGYPTFLMQTQTPTASYESGRYENEISVALSSVTPGARIYYTLDGSKPTENSYSYNGAIKVSKTTTIRAIATADGCKASEVASYTYTYQAKAPKANYASGSYTKPISVKLSTATPGVTIYYTLDGSKPTQNSYSYYNPIRIAKTTTLRAIAVSKDYTESVESVYKYSYRLATPKASLNSGKYQGAVSVKLSCAAKGAKIYYTTNGKNPTAKSTRYKGGTIRIKKTTTLKAIAINGSAKSKVLKMRYVIRR